MGGIILKKIQGLSESKIKQGARQLSHRFPLIHSGVGDGEKMKKKKKKE